MQFVREDFAESRPQHIYCDRSFLHSLGVPRTPMVSAEETGSGSVYRKRCGVYNDLFRIDPFLDRFTEKYSLREDMRPADARSLWIKSVKDLYRRIPDFCTSDDAKLLPTSQLRKHRYQYEGLPVNIGNCLALRVIYRVYFRTKAFDGVVDEEELKRMVFTVSQFLRLCVARSMCDVEDVWMEKTLYEQVTNFAAVRCFVEYISECFRPRSVIRKAKHLRKICVIASGVHGVEIQHENSRTVSHYLQQVIEASKGPSQHRRYISESQVLSRDEVKRCSAVAQEILIHLITWYKNETAQNLTLHRTDETEFVKEWFRAFISLLLLCSGGQRPQVISQIQIPRPEALERILKDGQKDGFLRLRTLYKRSAQSLRLPLVTLPSFFIPFLSFHLRYIHPAICRLSNVSGYLHNHFLLNSVKGEGMVKSSAIAYIIKDFVSDVYPFKNVSPLSLQQSCIRIQFDAYRRGELFPSLSEIDFFELLAKNYCSSAEQIRKWVKVERSKEYQKTVKELADVLDNYVSPSTRYKRRESEYSRYDKNKRPQKKLCLDTSKPFCNEM